MQDRRKFLKLAGAALLGATGAPLLSRLAGAQHGGEGPHGAGAAQEAGASHGAEAGPGARPVHRRGLRAGRWGMVVDPRKCLRKHGCRVCIEACHHTHNVPTIGNYKHAVKWVWKEEFRHAFPTEAHEHVDAGLLGKDVLVLCNHCANPPCVRVCPAQATWKRSDGIVMMDEHRCVGCRYCVVGCPYGSRSFNFESPRPYLRWVNPDFPTRMRGVVEKCNFCVERLSEGLLPLCVEACPEKALAFGDLGDPGSIVRQLLHGRYSIRRKPELGTLPQVFYLV